MTRRIPLVFGVTIVLALPASGRAQPTPQEHQKAVVAFQEARALIHEGHCDQAIPKLQASVTFEPSVGAHLSLADCYLEVDPLAAWRQLKEAEFLAYTKHDDRTADIANRAAVLEPKLATVHVVMAPATLDLPGLEVRLDDAVVDRFQYGGRGILALYPGRHRMTAVAPGKRPLSLTFESVIGAPATANIVLDDAVTAPPPLPPPAPRPEARSERPPVPPELSRSPHDPGDSGGTRQRRIGLLVGGLGAAGVVVGAITGTLTLSKKSSLQSMCGAFSDGRFVCPVASRTQVDDAYSSAKTLGTVSTAAFVAGGVLLAAGVVVYFTAPRSQGTATTLGVAATSGMMGLGLAQTW